MASIRLFLGSGTGWVQAEIDDSVIGGGVTLRQLTLQLADLQAAGPVDNAQFNMGDVMPAGAYVFPDSAQLNIVTPLGTGVVPPHIDVAIQGGNKPDVVQMAVQIDNIPGIFGGGSGTVDINQLCSEQGGQQVILNLAIGVGNEFSALTQGELIASILYCVPAAG